MREIKYMIFDCCFDYGSMLEISESNGNLWMLNEISLGNIMQFTGLKDKNDKEIYEGDIIADMISNRNYEIVWNDNGFWDAIGSEYKLTSPIGLCRLSEHIEVVGNIYENKELLK